MWKFSIGLPFFVSGGLHIIYCFARYPDFTMHPRQENTRKNLNLYQPEMGPIVFVADYCDVKTI